MLHSQMLRSHDAAVAREQVLHIMTHAHAVTACALRPFKQFNNTLSTIHALCVVFDTALKRI